MAGLCHVSGSVGGWIGGLGLGFCMFFLFSFFSGGTVGGWKKEYEERGFHVQGCWPVVEGNGWIMMDFYSRDDARQER